MLQGQAQLNLLVLGTNIGTSLAFYRGQKGFSLENPRKESEKGFPAEKVRKRLENEPKTRKKLKNGRFSTLFRGFFDPGGREAPGTPFSDSFLGFSRGEAFLTPVEGQRCPKTNRGFSIFDWKPNLSLGETRAKPRQQKVLCRTTIAAHMITKSFCQRNVLVRIVS